MILPGERAPILWTTSGRARLVDTAALQAGFCGQVTWSIEHAFYYLESVKLRCRAISRRRMATKPRTIDPDHAEPEDEPEGVEHGAIGGRQRLELRHPQGR
jgi:hypothetical protein